MTVGPGTLAVRVGAGRPAQLRLRRFGSYRFLRYDLKGGTTLCGER